MIRLGVVGHGYRASVVINKGLRQVEPGLKVVGIVDTDEAGAKGRLPEEDRAGVKFYANVKELVRKGKIDGLLIGTNCDTHAAYAIEAAKYDIPLFLEKPVAVNMEQAEALEEAFEDSRCEVVVSFPLRVSALCRLAREFIEKGGVGSCEHITGLNYVPYGTCYWELGEYRNYKVTQGLFLQKATHDFDYMMYLMGSNIVRVGAMATYGRVFGGDKPTGLWCSKCDEQDSCKESPQNRIRNSSTSDELLLRDHKCVYGEDVGNPQEGMNEDSSSAVVEFAGGGHGIYTQVFFSRRDAGMRGATVSGYMGTVSFDWYKNELRHVRHHEPFTETVKVSESLGHFGGDMELAWDFINLIKGKGKSRSTIREGIQSVYACLAAKESARTGAFVKVRQTKKS